MHVLDDARVDYMIGAVTDKEIHSTSEAYCRAMAKEIIKYYQNM